MKVVAILSMLHEAAGAPDSAVASTNSSFRLSQDGTGGDLIAEAGDSGTQNFETAGDGAGAAVAAPVQALTTSAATGAVGDNSATRRLRGEPVLAWTLRRLARSKLVASAALLCWEDQRLAVERIASAAQVAGAAPRVFSRGVRSPVAAIDSVTAARRWSDGWRGGLLGACDFDRGFFAPWAQEALAQCGGDAVLLVDPAAALVDADLIDSLIRHSEEHTDFEMTFSQAAPGLSGVLIRQSILDRLVSGKTHAGWALSYRPELPQRDPIASEACAPVPTPLARTLHRFSLDSRRQVRRVSEAVNSVKGQLISTGAESLLSAMNSHAVDEATPREIVLELNTRRASRPVYWAGRRLEIERPEMSLETAAALFGELAEVDDLRLTLAGVGDPLLYEPLFDVIDAAASAGIKAISVETDLLDVKADRLGQLARSAVDVVSVQLPAVTAQTYAAVMGVDGMQTVLANLKEFFERRNGYGRLTPMVVPTFAKCRMNLAEMETWYDQWIRAIGAAVIVGPSDYCGKIPDAGVADMSPPLRRACGRLARRMTILSDGVVVSCEQDVTGERAMGTLPEDSIVEIWQKKFGALRADHGGGNWDRHALCAGCKEWHRP